MLGARGALGLDGSALVIANPLPEDQQLDPELHERVLSESLAAAAAEGVRGRDVTPFLLARFHEGTGGESLRANVALVLANARLAGEIAAAQAQALDAMTIVAVGDLMVDVVAAAAEPLAHASDTEARVRWTGGGAAANVAAWLAEQGVGRRAGRAGGRRPRGPRRGRRAARRRASTRMSCSTGERATGTCVVVIGADGERTMLPDRGANLALAPDDLPAELFAAGNHLHLSGYVLLHDGPRAAGLRALELARAAGMTISVDPASAAPLRAAGVERFLEWIGGSTCCCPTSTRRAC